MRSSLPRIFNPNRLFGKTMRTARVPEFHAEEMERLVRAFQNGIRNNLSALLIGKPPVAMDAEDLSALTPTPRVSGRRKHRRTSGPSLSVTVPASEMILLLLDKPASLPALATPGPNFGAEILLPMVMRQAYSDAVFRHEIAETCRVFLCGHVVFHPGSPPRPDFSVAGLGLLILSQPGHALTPQPSLALLRAAIADLAEPYRPWDQWLLRLMDKANEWSVPQDLRHLPWVAWTPKAGTDEAALIAAGLPAYWPSVLDLDP